MINFSSICIVWISICVYTLSAEPEISVSGPVGSTAVLPCFLPSVDSENTYIRWGIESEIVFERLGEKSFQGEGYEGRVDVSEEELRKGNCSLVLRNLRLTDAGLYTSYARKEILISQIKLLVPPKKTRRIDPAAFTVSALIKTDSSISSAPSGSNQAVMKSPHPLILVLSLISCLLVQLFCGET
ncbi:uncharacterized protein Hap1MRO34_003149 [Clarias gariepinus]